MLEKGTSSETHVTTASSKSRLVGHPWLSALILVLLIMGSALLTNNLLAIMIYFHLPVTQVFSTAFGFLIGFLTFIIMVPKVLGIPFGKSSVREYLWTIKIQKPASIIKTISMFIPLVAILIFSQMLGSFLYNYFILGWDFNLYAAEYFTFYRALPPRNMGILVAIPSIWEEVVCRGILLSMFLRKMSERRAIISSSFVWASFHLMNLLSPQITEDCILFVVGQLIWCSIYGLLYGYMFVKFDSLFPNMALHYLGNAFMNLWVYTPYASMSTTVLLGVTFSLGVIPTTLSLLWMRFGSRHFLTESDDVLDSKPVSMILRGTT